MTSTDHDWNERYLKSETPWDSGLPERELIRVLDDARIAAGRAIELGCGTGTNAIALAKRGFTVTAIDIASKALEMAREKAKAAKVDVEWIEADVLNFGAGLPPFDFVFDRGCYHCCRRENLDGYLATLRNITRPGSLYLSLAGNADEQNVGQGPPRVTAVEITTELEPLFRIRTLRAANFEDAGGAQGPLGWSTLLERR